MITLVVVVTDSNVDRIQLYRFAIDVDAKDFTRPGWTLGVSTVVASNHSRRTLFLRQKTALKEEILLSTVQRMQKEL